VNRKSGSCAAKPELMGPPESREDFVWTGLLTNSVATVSKENPMKSLYALLALVSVVGFAVPASAVDLSNVKSQAACEAAGGVWDREADGCVAKQSQRACELRDGTWDEGSSTCSVPQ
jgi:uncharacterized lipoprotein YddW (UPF0748 family)